MSDFHRTFFIKKRYSREDYLEPFLAVELLDLLEVFELFFVAEDVPAAEAVVVFLLEEDELFLLEEQALLLHLQLYN